MLWARHRLVLFLAILFGASHTGMFYGTASYIKSFLDTIHASTAADGSGIQSTIYAAGILTGPLVALATDACGTARAAVAGLAASLLLVLPSWLLLVSRSQRCLPYLGELIFALLHAATSIPLLTLMVGLFPTSVRATGYGLAYNLAQLLFAAFAPIICNHLWSAVSGGTPSGSHALTRSSRTQRPSYGRT